MMSLPVSGVGGVGGRGSLSGGGVSVRRDTPLGRWMIGRYASYLNAYLLVYLVLRHIMFYDGLVFSGRCKIFQKSTPSGSVSSISRTYLKTKISGHSLYCSFVDVNCHVNITFH